MSALESLPKSIKAGIVIVAGLLVVLWIIFGRWPLHPGKKSAIFEGFSRKQPKRFL